MKLSRALLGVVAALCELRTAVIVRRYRISLVASLLTVRAMADDPVYCDPAQSTEARVQDLVSRLTLEEKASLMQNTTAGVARLGIPKYDWWNEALHGVARAGEATVFPQAIGLAAMWDEAFMQQVAHTIAIEARAKFNGAVGHQERGLALLRAHVLDAQHQYFPRSPLGSRAGDLRRGSVPHDAQRPGLRARPAGR